MKAHRCSVVSIHAVVSHTWFMASMAMSCSRGRMVLVRGPFKDMRQAALCMASLGAAKAVA